MSIIQKIYYLERFITNFLNTQIHYYQIHFYPKKQLLQQQIDRFKNSSYLVRTLKKQNHRYVNMNAILHA